MTETVYLHNCIGILVWRGEIPAFVPPPKVLTLGTKCYYRVGESTNYQECHAYAIPFSLSLLEDNPVFLEPVKRGVA